ncbi:hypothetical protein ACVNNN_02410 [Lysinibacillus fusiformis]|uniref:hypothetical protein n=1 Tax=Lysinibacillus sp. PWR01 TaxID=3342384 RepID=UPI00372D873E
MGFWNTLGLSSKKDNDQLHEEIKLLKQTIENQSMSQNLMIETNMNEILKSMSKQNEQFLSLLNTQMEVINNNNLYITEQISNLEKSTSENLDTQTKEVTKILKLQNKKIQKLDNSTQQLEKMNAEILKSMQAIWLIQLSQQVENELIKK